MIPSPAVSVVADLPYGDLPRRRLDLYLPNAPDAPTPLLMFMHGGAWVSGDKGECANVGHALAARGVAVALVNYRLSERTPDSPIKHPAHTEDCAAAVAWLRRNAGRHGYDAERIFAGGHSAGGHMAGLLALDERFLGAAGETPSSVRGYFSLEGVFDIPAFAARWPSYLEWFLNGAMGADGSLWEDASPQRKRGGAAVPWLLVHSPHDELVETEQSENFAAHLRALGAPVEYFSALQHSHYAVVQSIGLPGDPTTEKLVEFANR